MIDQYVTPRELVRRWADAHAVAYCILSVLAIGRVAYIQLAQPGMGIQVFALVLHVIAANVALAWILLVPHSASSRLLSATAGLGISLIVTAGLARVLSEPPFGPSAFALLASIPSGVLIGIAFVSIPGAVFKGVSTIRVIAAVLFAVALASLLICTTGLVQQMLGALRLVAVHSVWMSAMYTVFGLVLEARGRHRSSDSPRG